MMGHRSALLFGGLAAALLVASHTEPLAHVPQPFLIADISAGAGSSSPFVFVDVNGIAFFAANDGLNGRELWRSDGTAAGTFLVKDIFPGGSGSNPNSLTNVNGTLFFAANDGVSGTEVWRSDGTVGGTVLVKDIFPGSGNGSIFGLLTNVNGTLFFPAGDGVGGTELWRSDGTPGGTFLVADISPGGGNSFPNWLTNVNGTLFFAANDVISGSELWKSDGTAAGTVMVRDIWPGSTSAFPSQLTNVNGTVFFNADDGVNGRELWQSDGTLAGTMLVKDIRAGGTSSFPDRLTDVDGTLFFSANDGINNIELWRSDGTALGTFLVTNIGPGGDGSVPFNLRNVNGTLFFFANDLATGFELWRSDGTPSGTVLVKDIRPGGAGAVSGIRFTHVDGTVFFTADDGVTGFELWQSDGTAGGTVLVKDILPGGGGSTPQALTNVGGTLFFSANDGATGVEPWALMPHLPNIPPTANAGLDQILECAGPGTMFTLDGSLSSDPNNDDLTFEWRNAADAVIGTTATLDVTGPLGTHTFTLIVDDGHGGVSSDEVTVVVGDTVAPGFLFPLAPIVAAQTSPEGTPVVLPMPVPTEVCDSAPTVTSDAPATFPLGATVVTWTVTDASGNSFSATQTVTVVDATPPVLTAPPNVTVEATGAQTPVALGAATAIDAVDPSPVVTNDAPAAFLLGTTLVTWTATDASGNASTATQSVTVVDTTAPALTIPADITVEATGPQTAAALGTATATDLADPSPLITNDAPATFPLGTTVVTWTAADASGNTSTATQRVTVVDTTPPTVTAPPGLTVEATGAQTAVALGAATAVDAVDPSPVVTNDATAAFPLGTTVVTWTATDASGNALTATQSVTVVDTTTPALTALPDVTVEATGAQTAVALGAATAVDAVDPSPVVTNNAPATFPLGTTVVTWMATDAHGNTSSAPQSITVIDTTPPVLTLPPPPVIEATSAAGAVVTYAASAVDTVDSALEPKCSPTSGTTFSLGTTNVECTATDGSGNSASDMFAVTVQDTTAPVLPPAPDITLEATGPGGATADYTFTASDGISGDLPVVCTPGGGSTFTLGETDVSCSAEDEAGNETSTHFAVTVVDTTPPALTPPPGVTVEATGPQTAVALGTATATDLADPTPVVTNDAPATFPVGTTVVTWTATDASGNALSATQSVTVVDTAPPTLSVPGDLVVTCVGLEANGHACVQADDPRLAAWLASATALDPNDETPTVTHDAPSTFPLGITTVTFTATDDAGNTAQQTAHVRVVYGFGGFRPPLLRDGTAAIQQGRQGRTIPVKLGLTCDNGTPVATAVATIAVFKLLDAATGVVDTTDLTVDAGSANDNGNLFRYDAVGQQYIYNLSTAGWSAPATYRIVVTLDDGTQHSVDFSLR